MGAGAADHHTMTPITNVMRRWKEHREAGRPARAEKARRRLEADRRRVETKRNLHVGGGGGI